MEKFIQILKRIFVLPAVLTILIAVPSFGLVIYTLVVGQQNLLAYLSYGLSAYALIITSTYVYRIIQYIRTNDIRTELDSRLKSEMAHRLLEDKTYRTKITLYVGVWINFAYISIKLYYGITLQSFWFVGLAIYYLLLTWMKGVLLQFLRKNEAVGMNRLLELRKMRRCGTMLVYTHIALAAIVFLMVFYNRSMDYPGLLIYVMAAYSFYSMGMAIYNLIKYRKSESPVMISLKILGFCTAMVSILSLETAMIDTFGTDTGEDFRFIMVSLTGAAVCILVLLLAMYMINYVKKEIQNIYRNS